MTRAPRFAAPAASIVMPAFNAERWIGEAIGSVLALDFADWELIVVDDGSTDGTAAKAACFKDPRISVVRTPRLANPAAARNLGVRRARGRYLCFLDADDVFRPAGPGTLLALLEARPDAFAVYGFCAPMAQDGRPLGGQLLRRPDGGFALPPGYSHEWRSLLLGDFSCLLPALAIRREAFARLGGLDERFPTCDDFQFYLKMFLDRPSGVVCVPVYVYGYRMHPAGLTKDLAASRRVVQNLIRTVDWALAQPGLPPEARLLKSLAHVRRYHYVARERLLEGRADASRRVALEALADPAVERIDWIRWCAPLLLRTALPAVFGSRLAQMRGALRRWRAEAALRKAPRRPLSALSVGESK